MQTRRDGKRLTVMMLAALIIAGGVAAGLVVAASPVFGADATVLVVYADADAPANHGNWSSIMTGGDGATLAIDPADRSRPASGQTAVRLDFTFGPTPGSWAGVAVTSAPGYWGEGPGAAFDLSSAGRLVFSARGTAGGERIRVKVAIAGDAPQGDASPLPFDSGWLALSAAWQTFELALDGALLQRVVTPFVVIANRAHNPAGRAVVYLDDIRFAPARP